MTAKTILLAEDDPRDLELTLAALEEYRLANKIVVARNGAEALDYLYRRGAYADRPPGQPVLIMLDLKMPKVDGIEVLRRLKGDPVMKVIPVVVLTSSKEERDIVDSYKLGVNAYIVKPVDFVKFVRAITGVGFFWLVLNQPPK